jgi:hypothetical protein
LHGQGKEKVGEEREVDDGQEKNAMEGRVRGGRWRRVALACA